MGRNGRFDVRAVFSVLIVLTVLSVTWVANAPTSDAQVKASSCADVRFIGARGSSEPQGLGRTIDSVYQSLTASSTANIDSQDLVYPASTVPLPGTNASIASFDASINQGIGSLTGTLNAQVGRCPEQKYVLAGYSQGAMVVDGALRNMAPALESRIIGVALFGDPRFDDRFTHNIGNFDPTKSGVTRWGFFTKGGEEYIPAQFTERTRSYCLAGDVVCNFSFESITGCTGANSSSCAHIHYVESGLTVEGGRFLASVVPRPQARKLPKVGSLHDLRV